MSYNSVMKLSVNLEDGNNAAVALALGGQRPDPEPPKVLCILYCAVLILYVQYGRTRFGGDQDKMDGRFLGDLI
jgi:hypothetical protein